MEPYKQADVWPGVPRALGTLGKPGHTGAPALSAAGQASSPGTAPGADPSLRGTGSSF